MGIDTQHLDAEKGAAAAIAAIRKLSSDIGIPGGLAELGAKADDIPILAANAMKDACGFTNPRPANQDEIEEIFRTAM
jgi:alcohol dehydrogenase